MRLCASNKDLLSKDAPHLNALSTQNFESLMDSLYILSLRACHMFPTKKDSLFLIFECKGVFSKLAKNHRFGYNSVDTAFRLKFLVF